MDAMMAARTMQNERQGQRVSEFRDIGNLIVVLSSIFIQAFGIGFPLSLGILYESLVETFGDLKTITAAVATTCGGVTFITGVLAAAFCVRFGPSATITLGGALAVLGLLSSVYASGLYFLLVSLGLVTGLGCAFLVIGGSTACVNQFEKEKNLAISLVVAGGGLGNLMFQQIQHYFITVYGWRGSLQLIAGVAAHTFIFGLLIRSFRKKKSLKDNCTVENFSYRIFCKAFLRNWRFVIWLVYILLATLSLPFPTVVMVDYSVQEKRFTESVGVWLLSMIALFTVLGSLATGVLVHLMTRFTMVYVVMATGTFGLTSILFAYIETEVHGYILVIVCGLSRGLVIGYYSVATLSLSGKDKFTQYYGIVSTVEGLSFLLAGPLLGWITDITGAYDMAFIVGGTMAFCACAIILASELIGYIRTPTDIYAVTS